MWSETVQIADALKAWLVKRRVKQANEVRSLGFMLFSGDDGNKSVATDKICFEQIKNYGKISAKSKDTPSMA